MFHFIRHHTKRIKIFKFKKMDGLEKTNAVVDAVQENTVDENENAIEEEQHDEHDGDQS